MTQSTAPVRSEPAPGSCDAAPAAAQSLLHFTDDLVCQIDPQGLFLTLNPAGHRILEVEEDATREKPWLVFVHENDQPRAREEWERFWRGDAEPQFEARLVGVLGRTTRARVRLHRADTPQGPTCLLVARDIGSLRHLEEQLQQSQKLETIGLLAGGIAHDINNMLTAILGYTELMAEEMEDDDPRRDGLRYMQESTERAAALVKQVVLFSRKSGADIKPVRLPDIVAETMRILERTLPKSIQISADLQEVHHLVEGDAGRIQQALMNLCLNARDAMPRGGTLRIDARSVQLDDPEQQGLARGELRPGDYVRVRIEDSGCGMTPEVLDNIWEPFFTTKPAGVGTGLGLATVRGIVQMHRGHAAVESRPGDGTTFTLFFPAVSSAGVAQAETLSEPPGGDETILVVDDEEVLVHLLEEILKPKGYNVLRSTSGEEALQYIDAVGDRIDLVLSDNMMPGMSGRELARHIREHRPDLPILVCSGFSPTRESEVSELDYVSSYVQKPYQRRNLLARVRETLDEARAAQCEGAS